MIMGTSYLFIQALPPPPPPKKKKINLLFFFFFFYIFFFFFLLDFSETPGHIFTKFSGMMYIGIAWPK